MATKVTYTLDEETVERVHKLAQQQRKPKSQIVREAVARYAERENKLSLDERDRQLAVLRDIVAQPPTRPQREVDEELRELRRARRSAGRLHPLD